jgi:hypothetical protein
VISFEKSEDCFGPYVQWVTTARVEVSQSWHKTHGQLLLLRSVLLTEHRLRGKLPQPLSLPHVREGLLLLTRNTGDVVRFQRRSLREYRHW